MDTRHARKRGLPEAAAFNGNGGMKKHKQEMEFISTGIGSKLKPCTKFFSTSGCPFGEGCHFLHYVPGGVKCVAQVSNLGSNMTYPSAAGKHGSFPSFLDSSSPQAAKTRMCNKISSAEGCRFGDKCHFAHSERELSKPMTPMHANPRDMGGAPRQGGRPVPPSPVGAAASFGSSATAKISVVASLAGAIIGKGGVNSKNICRVTGAKLAIRDHESDPNLRNIELEGTFDQIKQASTMVQELILNAGSCAGPLRNSGMAASAGGSYFKTKPCVNFARGTCTFGERCHFAHGADERRNSLI